jgi:hypothetical protein
MSLEVLMSNFLNPLGRMWRVFLLEPLPICGRAWLPLNLRRILESIPWGVLQDFYKKQAQNETRKRVTYSDSIVLIGSEAVGVVLLLLDDLGLVQGLDGHLFIFNKESNAKFS